MSCYPNSQVSCFERIWQSSSLLDTLDLEALNKELSLLSRQGKSQEPDGLTSALIDPFLHCFVYNRTIVSHIHRCPRPQSPPPLTDIYTFSQRFALLPADVSVSPTGSATFLSYINNLDPCNNTSLYRLLEKTLSAFVPIFEHTLTDLHRNNPLPQRIIGPCRYTIWDEPDPPEYSDDEEGWSNYEREMRHWTINRPLELPDVPMAYPGGLEHRKHLVNLKGRKVQIIVQASDIRLVGAWFPFSSLRNSYFPYL